MILWSIMSEVRSKLLPVESFRFVGIDIEGVLRTREVNREFRFRGALVGAQRSLMYVTLFRPKRNAHFVCLYLFKYLVMWKG